MISECCEITNWIRVSGWVSDMTCTMHHVEDGGCHADFTTAMLCGHPDYMEPPGDGEGCVKATAALRRRFAGNPEWFKHK